MKAAVHRGRESNCRLTRKSTPAAFLDTPCSGSKNLFLTFGTLYGVPKYCSDPNPHVRRDRLPAEALSTKCGNPLLVKDPSGSAQLLALRLGISQSGADALGNQTALQFSYSAKDGKYHAARCCGRLEGFRQTYELDSQHTERVKRTQ